MLTLIVEVTTNKITDVIVNLISSDRKSDKLSIMT